MIVGLYFIFDELGAFDKIFQIESEEQQALRPFPEKAYPKFDLINPNEL